MENDAEEMRKVQQKEAECMIVLVMGLNDQPTPDHPDVTMCGASSTACVQ
jgi:hypothetical protein